MMLLIIEIVSCLMRLIKNYSKTCLKLSVSCYSLRKLKNPEFVNLINKIKNLARKELR